MKKVAFVMCNDMHMDIAHANALLNSIVQNDGYEVVCDYTIADIVIVNTCAFGPNKMYSVRVLADVRLNSKPEAKVIATGCLLKLNSDELEVLPGIDIKPFNELIDFFGKASNLQVIVPQNRVIISEGCLHKCSYCVYPMLVEKYKSKPIESILDEIDKLYDTESTIYITGSHETSDYGIDLYGKRSFAKLLNEIAKRFPNSNFVIGWFHPAGLTNDVINVISQYENIVEIMLHIQHVSPSILKNMSRPSFESTDKKIQDLKKVRPDLVISTEVIVGFPGETEQDFDELVNYLKKGYFDDIGVASYEPVLGTKAALLPNQVDIAEKERRLNIIKQIFSATCYPSPVASSDSIIEEYFMARNFLYNLPKFILNDRQEYNCVAGVDTREKLENFSSHLSLICKYVISSRTEYDFVKNQRNIIQKYTLEARRLFFEIMNNGDFKEKIKERARKLLLDE